MRRAIVLAWAVACGSTAPITGRAGAEVELGDEGLRGLEYGEPITPSAIRVLLPGGTLRRDERTGGTTVFTVDDGGAEGAIEITDHDPVGVQRHVVIRSSRLRTALGVRPGDRLGALMKRAPVRCVPQSGTLLDCHVPGTRFSLRTAGSALAVEEMSANLPDLEKHRDHVILYIAWLGPVRSRELRAQPLERATVTRGGIGPVARMRVELLSKVLPRGAAIRERRVGDDLELVVERAGQPYLRFETSEDYLTGVIVVTRDIQTARGIRIGDRFGGALGITCWVETVRGGWRARCDDGDVELVLEPHTGTPPGGGGDHATVPPRQVAGDRIVEIRSRLH